MTFVHYVNFVIFLTFLALSAAFLHDFKCATVFYSKTSLFYSFFALFISYAMLLRLLFKWSYFTKSEILCLKCFMRKLLYRLFLCVSVFTSCDSHSLVILLCDYVGTNACFLFYFVLCLTIECVFIIFVTMKPWMFLHYKTIFFIVIKNIS